MLLGDIEKSAHLISELCSHHLPLRVFTHTHTHTSPSFLPLHVLQSHNEGFHPRPPPLCPCLCSSSLRLFHSSPLCFSLVLSYFIPMLYSNRAVYFFIYFSPTLLHLGQQRPTGTYVVCVFIPSARLWPRGKLQSVISLQVDRNAPLSSSTRVCSHFKVMLRMDP